MTFEVFWRDYPRKDGKKYALKCYERAVKKRGAQRIIDGLTAWNRVRKECDLKFIPHASTWLNQERFMDDFEQLAAPAVMPTTPKVLVGGIVFGYVELSKIRSAIVAGRRIEPIEWEAFKKWQELGNWTEVRLPLKPEPLPSPEERRACIEDLQKRGLL